MTAYLGKSAPTAVTTRRYEESHPWITFELDLRKLDWEIWMLLGEALSKCEHIAGVPLQPTVAKELHGIYLSKGVHATTQIEGNTLSEEDVRKQIDGDLEVPPSQEYLKQEVVNILDACNTIIEDVVENRSLQLTPARALWFNGKVLAKLPPKEGAVAGRIREMGVGVGNVYKGAPPEDCEYLLDRLCDWLEQLQADAPEHLKKPVAILSAVLAHLYIAWIHPFGDGNGRTARLIEFQLLVRAGVPIVAAHLLSDHYNTTRNEYYRQLTLTSRREPFSIDGMIKYALHGFADGLKAQIDVIRGYQLDVMWSNFIHTAFHDKNTPACVRQRRLALTLSPTKPTPRSGIHILSPELARDYANKGTKTVNRDINALHGMNLIQAVPGGLVANIEIVRAFMPLRVNEQSA